ncbi:hypothetical protein OROHE_005934 [Orobanche hederae]
MWNLTVFLSIIWALNLLYGEWFAYLVPSLRTCSWPHLQRPSSSLRNGADYSSSYVKIVVITDPQLMDRTSFHLARKSLALEIAQFYTDLYMRRAFLSSILPFNPDVVLFLGDYFDGGDRLSDDEYVSLFAMTLVIVLVWPVNEVLIYRKLGDLMVSLRSMYNSFSTRVKEKNEDENCEYEEIWDAEGSMHLIKKTRKVSTTSLNDSSSPERGNAVMRSKVRKQMGPEQDGPIPDVSIHIGPITRTTHRSKAKTIIWRLLRALRALITIAAFNVPLYVLLVFKDWIDK